MALQERSEHQFSWWHQGVMLFDRDYEWSPSFDEYVEAASGAWLDQSRSRGVTYVAPGGSVFASLGARLTIELHDQEPPIERAADSVGDFDLVVPSGVLILEESGGGGTQTEVLVAAGEWRSRWSGFGELVLERQDADDTIDEEDRPDRYLLQLWPTAEPRSVRRLTG